MSRLLNLKKLKSQYNIYNSSKFVKEKYNRGNKYISVFDKKNNSEELKEKNNNQQKNIKIMNKDAPSGNNFGYNKKYISNNNSINTQNLTDNQNHKFRVGLLSACSNSNNNVFIPYVSLHRPLSNFNIGGQLNINKYNLTKKNMNINMNIIKNNYNNIREGIGTAPEKKREEYKINKNYSNIFSSINIYGQKLHNIKIDKSMMNNKLKESLNKNMILNYMNLVQNKFPKINNYNQYHQIKNIYNIKNNSIKN